METTDLRFFDNLSDDNTIGNANTSDKFETMLEESYIDLSKVYEMQPMAISMGSHNYADKIYNTTVCSYGDFSAIVGLSKSKKTFFKSLLAARYAGGRSDNYGSELKGHGQAGKYIIDIDTEQSKFHSYRAFKRVERMTQIENNKFYVPISLREYSAQDRLDFIEWLLLESKYAGQIGLVFIDGSADLVNDVNDLVKCNDVVGRFLKWTTLAKCHIVTVIHRNFATNKATGHLGSAILKKAETVFLLEADEDDVLVTPERTRNIPFEPFRFSVDRWGLPYIKENYILPRNNNAVGDDIL